MLQRPGWIPMAPQQGLTFSLCVPGTDTVFEYTGALKEHVVEE